MMLRERPKQTRRELANMVADVHFDVEFAETIADFCFNAEVKIHNHICRPDNIYIYIYIHICTHIIALYHVNTIVCI